MTNPKIAIVREEPIFDTKILRDLHQRLNKLSEHLVALEVLCTTGAGMENNCLNVASRAVIHAMMDTVGAITITIPPKPDAPF